QSGKESFIEQKKTLGTVTYKGTALSTLFGAAPGTSTWDDIMYVQTWEGSFGGKQKSEAYQVSTTDESVTRMISEKYIDGVKQSGKESYIEQVKQSSLDARFGDAPSGKTWDDSVLVKTWDSAFDHFGDDPATEDVVETHFDLRMLKSQALQVSTTDESVTRMITRKIINGLDQGDAKESFIEQRITTAAEDRAKFFDTTAGAPAGKLIGTTETSTEDVLAITMFDKAFNAVDQKAESYTLQLDVQGNGSWTRSCSFFVNAAGTFTEVSSVSEQRSIGTSAWTGADTQEMRYFEDETWAKITSIVEQCERTDGATDTTIFEVNYTTAHPGGEKGVPEQFLRQIELTADVQAREGMRTVIFSDETRTKVLGINDGYSSVVPNRGSANAYSYAYDTANFLGDSYETILAAVVNHPEKLTVLATTVFAYSAAGDLTEQRTYRGKIESANMASPVASKIMNKMTYKGVRGHEIEDTIENYELVDGTAILVNFTRDYYRQGSGAALTADQVIAGGWAKTAKLWYSQMYQTATENAAQLISKTYFLDEKKHVDLTITYTAGTATFAQKAVYKKDSATDTTFGDRDLLAMYQYQIRNSVCDLEGGANVIDDVLTGIQMMNAYPVGAAPTLATATYTDNIVSGLYAMITGDGFAALATSVNLAIYGTKLVREIQLGYQATASGWTLNLTQRIDHTYQANGRADHVDTYAAASGMTGLQLVSSSHYLATREAIDYAISYSWTTGVRKASGYSLYRYYPDETRYSGSYRLNQVDEYKVKGTQTELVPGFTLPQGETLEQDDILTKRTFYNTSSVYTSANEAAAGRTYYGPAAYGLQTVFVAEYKAIDELDVNYSLSDSFSFSDNGSSLAMYSYFRYQYNSTTRILESVDRYERHYGLDSQKILDDAAGVEDQPASTTGTVQVISAATPGAATTDLDGATAMAFGPSTTPSTVTGFTYIQNGNPGTMGQTQTTGFSFNYDYASGSILAANKWAGAAISFDQGFDCETQDLVLEVQRPAGTAAYYLLDLIDKNGKTVTVKVTAFGKVQVTSAILRSAGVDGFNAGEIKTVVVRVNDPNAKTGTLSVSVTGMGYKDFVVTKTRYKTDGSVDYTENYSRTALYGEDYTDGATIAGSSSAVENRAPSNLNGATATALGSAPGKITGFSTNADVNVFSYNNFTAEGDYAGTRLNFGSPYDFSANGDMVLRVTGTSAIRAVVTDANGHTVSLFFGGIGEDGKDCIVISQNALQALNSAFGSTVQSVSLVVDKAFASGRGTVRIEGEEGSLSPSDLNFGFNYVTGISAVPAMEGGSVSNLATYGVNTQAVASAGGAMTGFSSHGTDVVFDYNVNAAEGSTEYAGASFSFGNGTPWNLESRRLVFTVRNTASSTDSAQNRINSEIKAIVMDASGKTAVIYFMGINMLDAGYCAIDQEAITNAVGASPDNFDLTQVTKVTFLIDKDVLTPQGSGTYVKGTVMIGTQGLPLMDTSTFTYPPGVNSIYADPLSSVSSLADSNVTSTPLASSAAQLTNFTTSGLSSGVGSVSFSYNINAATDYAGFQLNLGTRWDLASQGSLVFGLQNTVQSGVAVDRVKVILKDSSGQTVVFVLNGIPDSQAGMQKFGITEEAVASAAGAGNLTFRKSRPSHFWWPRIL
ncbi:MAG: hypothetical protein WCK89_10965, partial [bacterium]